MDGSEDLAWVADVIWGGSEGVEVCLGSAPHGRVPIETYRVVPGRRAPRLLLPVDPRMAWAAARDGRATRSRRASSQRTLAGIAARAGRLALRDKLTVHAEPGAQARTLAAAMGEVVGARVGLAVNVRPPGPYRKPVAQVIDGGGRVLAYAKVAWNDLTDVNVKAEADALEAVGRSGAAVGVPSVKAMLSWKGRTVLLTDPMPAGLRRFHGMAPDPSVVAGIAAAGGVVEQSLGDGRVLERLRARLVGARGALPAVAEATGQLLDALGTDAGVIVPTGRWHGDWSRWNLGTFGERLWAWDWEYSRTGVPLGLDLPHFHFQSAFIAQRRDLGAAFDHARAKGSGELSAIGLGPDAIRVVLGVHAAEVALRYLEAEAAGARANPRFVREAVPVLRAAADRVARTRS